MKQVTPHWPSNWPCDPDLGGPCLKKKDSQDVYDVEGQGGEYKAYREKDHYGVKFQHYNFPPNNNRIHLW